MNLPQTAQDKGAEVEEGFVTMANLVNMLSALSAEYKAARQAVPPVAAKVIETYKAVSDLNKGFENSDKTY